MSDLFCIENGDCLDAASSRRPVAREGSRILRHRRAPTEPCRQSSLTSKEDSVAFRPMTEDDPILRDLYVERASLQALVWLHRATSEHRKRLTAVRAEIDQREQAVVDARWQARYGKRT